MEKIGEPGLSSRHAYLITVYDNFPVLDVLLRMLDDPRNEVFIHVDRRVRNFDYEYFAKLCRSATVIFVPRVRVHWGHYSQIQSVFNLLERATETPHSYYHLLSGADLPIKSQDHIHDFCARHSGKEFVGYGQGDFRSRLRWFYFFNYSRRPNSRPKELAAHFFAFAEKVSLSLQSLLGVNRLQGFDQDIKKGSDWFSVTHQAAEYLLANREKVARLFRFADIPTEFYAQTFLWNSQFRDHIFDREDEFRGSLRHVDWSRGSPYVFRRNDLSDLLASPALFARKFEADVDMGIVRDLLKVVSPQHPTPH